MGLLVGIAVFVLPGLAWARLLRRRHGVRWTGLACVAAGFLLAFGLLSVLGLVLAFAGVFRPAALVAGVAVATLAPLAAARRGSSATPTDSAGRRGRWPAAVWAALLLAGAALYARPGENLLGAWDPGVYLATSAQLAREGSWRTIDRAAPLFEAGEREAVYGVIHGRPVKYPGFYLAPAREGELQPQFFPLYPVLAAWLHMAGGIRAALWSSSLLTWLSLVFLILAAREAGGPLCAALAGLALLANPAQAWFSGFQTAEVAMQFAFVAGLWAWLLWHRTDSRLAAALAGGGFALTAFASVTGLLLVPLLAVGHLCVTARRRSGLLFLAPPAALAPLMAWQLSAMTPIYFAGVRGAAGVARALLLRPPVLLAFAALALLAVAAVAQRRVFARPAAQRLLRAVAAAGAAAGLALVAGALYGGDLLNSRWLAPAALLSKTGLLAGFAGLLWLGWRRPALLPVVVLAPLAFSFVFAERPMMTQVYPWAFKRWLPALLPVAVLGMGFFWTQLAAVLKARRAAAAAVLTVAALLLVRPLYRGRDFAFVRDWRGLDGHLSALDALLEKDALLLADRTLGTPLEFVHGRTVIPIYRGRDREALGAAVARQLEAGTAVYVVRPATAEADLPFHVEPVTTVRDETRRLEQSRNPFRVPVRTVRLESVIEAVLPAPETPSGDGDQPAGAGSSLDAFSARS